jgi:hypothetical protein
VSPSVLSARQFVPPLGLSNPFSPVSGLKPRPLQAIQFHYRVITVAHKLSSPVHTLFLLLRQSHHDYATELFLDLLVKAPLMACGNNVCFDPAKLHRQFAFFAADAGMGDPLGMGIRPGNAMQRAAAPSSIQPRVATQRAQTAARSKMRAENETATRHPYHEHDYVTLAGYRARLAESRGRTYTGDSSCCPPGGTASESNLNQA